MMIPQEIGQKSTGKEPMKEWSYLSKDKSINKLSALSPICVISLMKKMVKAKGSLGNL